MEILRRLSRNSGGLVEFLLFGTNITDPDFHQLPRDFPWKLAGEINQRQVVTLLNQCDIFADFSTYQAMGLTAIR